MNKKYMSKTSKQTEADDEMLPEYNFDVKKGIRGKYAKRYREGVTVTIHRKNKEPLRYKEVSFLIEEDVAKVFRTSEEVNAALRAVITAIPKRSKRAKHI
jgi:hypothetical protein